jgi:hypothetical protein
VTLGFAIFEARQKSGGGSFDLVVEGGYLRNSVDSQRFILQPVIEHDYSNIKISPEALGDESPAERSKFGVRLLEHFRCALEVVH